MLQLRREPCTCPNSITATTMLGGQAIPDDGELPPDRIMSKILDTGPPGLFELELVGASKEKEPRGDCA